MSTTVNVAIEDVMLIAALGVDNIKGHRNELLEKHIHRIMQEKKWSWREFSRVFRYTTRAQAIEALKKEGLDDFFGTSTYLRATRYTYQNDENRLKQLSKMAQSSIDGAIRLNSEDHGLIRKYAPALHKFVQDTTGLSHPGAV